MGLDAASVPRRHRPGPKKLLEQFGGATGELSAALTYFTQSFHCEDQGIRDMLAAPTRRNRLGLSPASRTSRGHSLRYDD